MNISRYFEATKSTAPAYYSSMFNQRLLGGLGSVFPFTDASVLEAVLLSADWEEVTHPNVKAPCRCFRATIPGYLGIVPLRELPKGTKLVADDNKDTGFVELTARMPRRVKTDVTYAIIGKEGDTEIVFTFHPGEPITPSTVSTTVLPAGTEISVDEAIAFGFTHAKVV